MKTLFYISGENTRRTHGLEENFVAKITITSKNLLEEVNPRWWVQLPLFKTIQLKPSLSTAICSQINIMLRRGGLSYILSNELFA